NRLDQAPPAPLLAAWIRRVAQAIGLRYQQVSGREQQAALGISSTPQHSEHRAGRFHANDAIASTRFSQHEGRLMAGIDVAQTASQRIVVAKEKSRVTTVGADAAKQLVYRGDE